LGVSQPRTNVVLAVGLTLSTVGVAGYLVGLSVAYPGRAFSVTGVMLGITFNTLSLSTNEVMEKLTVVATIVLPLTFVVGVYGMNFADSPYNMPELSWVYGYPAVILGMLGLTVVLVTYFRQEGYV